MAFLFPRNKQKLANDLVRSVKESLQKLVTLDQLPTAVRTVPASPSLPHRATDRQLNVYRPKNL
jgi:hypothetical protein